MYVRLRSVTMQTVLVAVVTLMNSCCGLMSVALAKAMHMCLVPSQYASLYEGIRGGFGKAAFLSASYLFPHLDLASPCLVILLTIVFWLFCARKQYFTGDLSYTQIGA